MDRKFKINLPIIKSEIFVPQFEIHLIETFRIPICKDAKIIRCFDVNKGLYVLVNAMQKQYFRNYYNLDHLKSLYDIDNIEFCKDCWKDEEVYRYYRS